MAEPKPEPAPSPPSDENLAPWEKGAEKPNVKLPGGLTTGWHDSRSKEKDRRKQIATAVAIFFGLVGLLIGMLLWIRTPTPDIELLAIPVSQYRHIEWVANPTADLDANEIMKEFTQFKGRASADQEVSNLRSLLNRLPSRDDPRTPLIVYVSALAHVHDGKAYILPGDARIGEANASGTWIPFADILSAMEKCTADHKALLLDLSRSPADPFHGPLLDDVQAQIDREILAADPKFPVLASCSPGERSLIIPELRLSAFAAFLAEGFRGEADGYRPGESPDNKLTFAELADFVIGRVSQWADAVPDVRQMPKRYGPDGAGFLLYRDRTRQAIPEAPGEPPPAPTVPGYPAELLNGWKVRDSYRDLGVYLAPDLVLDLESRLLRAEDRYLAGIDFDPPQNDPAWRTAVTRLERRTALWRAPKPSSISELRAGRKPPAPELVVALEKWIKLRFPPKDDTGKPLPVLPADIEKLEGETLNALLAGDLMLDGFAYYWQKLVDDPTPTAEKIENIASLLDRGRFADLPLTNEYLLLKRLAKTKLPAFAYPDAVRALLQSEQAFGETLVATGGRLAEGFRRIQPLYSKADTDKQAAEAGLFKTRPNSDEVEAVHQKLKLATQQLKSVTESANELRGAHRAAADATADLHASLPGMIATDRPTFDRWLTAAGLASQLADRLVAEGPLQVHEIKAIDALARKLRGSASALALADAAQIKKFTEDAQQRPQATSFTELQKLLVGSRLSAEERAGIAAGFRKVSASRYATARAKFDKEHIRTPVEHPKAEDPFLRAPRRGRGSFEMLRLAGFAEADKLDVAIRTAGSDSSKWQALSDRSIAVWNREVPAAAAVDLQKARWRTVERVLRAAPPRLDGFDRERGFGELFLSEEVDRRKWLAERFGEYGKLRAGVLGASAFYSELAEDYDRPLAKGAR